jgi:hypothetical protein
VPRDSVSRPNQNGRIGTAFALLITAAVCPRRDAPKYRRCSGVTGTLREVDIVIESPLMTIRCLSVSSAVIGHGLPRSNGLSNSMEITRTFQRAS